MTFDMSVVPTKVVITATEELGIELPIMPFGKVALKNGESIELIANTSSELLALTLLSKTNHVKVTVGDSEPTHDEKVTVKDTESLQNAFNNPNVKEITLDADLPPLTGEMRCTSGVTFDGNGHTLTFSNTGRNLVFLKPSVIKNVKIVNTAGTAKKGSAKASGADVWSSTYGMQLFNGVYTVENFSCTGCNAALLCNSADVTISGEIDVSGNGFGGIEVSKSAGVTQVSPVLRVQGAIIKNTTEKYAKPTIWIDGDVGEVEASGFTEANINGQRQFYLDPSHAVAPEESADSE